MGFTCRVRYEKVNELLLKISNDLDADLWILDAIWPDVSGTSDELEEEVVSELDTEGTDKHFGLERHLHDFLYDNWEGTELGQEWNLDEEGGDIKGYGYERLTSIGKIDLLAKHKTEPRWLIIELKRGQTSDDTIGQVLRYMGWVKEHLATTEENVEGLVVAHGEDDKLRYALKATQGVRFMRYEVDFRLVEEQH